MEENLEHRALDTFELNGQMVTPCSCGRRFTSNTPSRARSRWQKHANEMILTSKSPKEPASPRVKSCGCGCGESLAARAGGLFRSGHDARFKSILTNAHAEDRAVRHPSTGEDTPALEIADWLDQRRGSGTFWRDKVLAGHRPAPERKPRPERSSGGTELRGVARVDVLMQALATRRPVPGDIGVVTLRSGNTCGAQVLQRASDTALSVRLLDGPEITKEIVVKDEKFEKANRR